MCDAAKHVRQRPCVVVEKELVYPICQEASDGAQKPTEFTGWTGGKQSVPAICACCDWKPCEASLVQHQERVSSTCQCVPTVSEGLGAEVFKEYAAGTEGELLDVVGLNIEGGC